MYKKHKPITIKNNLKRNKIAKKKKKKNTSGSMQILDFSYMQEIERNFVNY